MEHKHAIVVDAAGYKQEFVLVELDLEHQLERPLYYEMQQGEKLVYDGIQEALTMHKPRWSGKVWKEAATAEEIEAAQPQPPPPSPPDPRDLAIAELTTALAAVQMQNDQAIAELTMMIAGG